MAMNTHAMSSNTQRLVSGCRPMRYEHLKSHLRHRSVTSDTVSLAERLTMSELIKPLLVDIPTAARMLAVSRDHVYRLIRNRELRSVEMGNGRAKTRIRVADLEALISSRTFA